MRIIKLNAIDSTNSYLRQLSIECDLDDYTIVMANYQSKGRGQMGTQWSSQDSKNLMVSVFKKVSFINIDQSFYISMVVALSIFEALKALQIKRLKIKWPNDILAENKKVGGILIENVIKHNQLQASVIGFGLNINQTEFDNLPQASSLRLLSGKTFDLDEVLQHIIKQLQYYFSLLEAGKYEAIKKEYEQHLFRKNKPSTFKDAEGCMFLGFILGVTNSGNLKIRLEDEIIKEFDLKEVTLLY